MINVEKSGRLGTARWGWRLLLTMSSLLAVNGIALYFFVADSFMMRIVSIMEVGMGLLSLLVSRAGARQGQRWIWHALWVPVALLATVGFHILLEEGGGVGAWYLSLAAVGLAGQLLAARGR